MAQIDVDMLRSYLVDHYGTAAFNGSPTAIIDAIDIESMDGVSLCQKAEQLGIDLNKFAIDDPALR